MQGLNDKEHLKGINWILLIIVPFMFFYLLVFGIKYCLANVETKVKIRRCLFGNMLLKMSSKKYETQEQLIEKIKDVEIRYLNLREEMPSLKEKISKRKVGKGLSKTAALLNKEGIPTEVKEFKEETEEQKKEQKTLQQALLEAGLGDLKRNKRKYLK